ncbi:MAG: division/cell wall cluster transcriptional repressor MraZ [Parcubacteria group bacterium]
MKSKNCTKPVFIGEYQHSIDIKGRLAVPAKFRARLAKGAVVTRGLDQSLFLYAMNEWQQLAERLSKLSIAKANTRAFARLMLAGAMDVQVDRQGRIIIPEYLRAYAKIGKQVVLAGLYSRIEIWDKATWERYTASTEKKSTDIAEQLTDLGV